ncbi:MAG: protein kinase [Pirellulaceae bacterium]
MPLPLARLYRQAANAKTALDRHQAAYFLWEASLKLLGSTAIAEYAWRGMHDPAIADSLTNLARPALGHWWQFLRLLAPALADAGDDGFTQVRSLVLGRTRDDLPRTAGLDAVLRDALGKNAGARATVRISELFDRLVNYRNSEIGHGAAGKKTSEFYQRLGAALLAGVPELLSKLDVLAGRRLIYVADVQRNPAGNWTIEPYELTGESSRRMKPLEISSAEPLDLPSPQRVYLQARHDSPAQPLLTSLYPLATYDPDEDDLLFLNARRGRRRSEYLSYTSGNVIRLKDLGGEQRELLQRVLDMDVDDAQLKQWSARSQAEEGPFEEPADSPTRTLGEFELLSTLGRGGMGVVYRAWQPSLGRQVALKCLMHSSDNSEARFAGEIRALGQVTHPHLVKIYTSGAEGDHWFYAMELLEGATLSAVCESLQTSEGSVADVNLETWHNTLSTVCEETRKAEKPLGESPEQLCSEVAGEVAAPPAVGEGSYVRRIVELIRDVAEAAHALHEAGIIHRDIKPGNIVVSPDGGQAVLMDLGLAQFADELDRKLTRTRQFVGTLRYASPEQVRAIKRLDARTDVYSLGATLWELLTLRPIFGADEELPTPEIMERIQYEEPERIRKHHPGVPADLEAIVAKCLEKEPRRRYESARELVEDLQRWLDDRPIKAKKATLVYRSRKFLRRHATKIGLFFGLVALQIALVVVWNNLPAWRGKDNPEKEGPTRSEVAAKEKNYAAIDNTTESEPPRSATTFEIDPTAYGGAKLPPAATSPVRFSLLVGLNYEEHAELAPLRYAERDVEELASVLVSGGYDEKNVLLLTEKLAAEKSQLTPTKENILRALESISNRCSHEDTLIVALSGHMLPLENDASSAFFVTFDSRLDDRSSMLSLSEVYGQLRACRARTKLVLADFPYQGGDPGHPQVQVNSASLSPPRDVAVLLSASAGQASYESPELERSVFFHYVIEGLAGRADADGDNEVTLADLATYTESNARKFTLSKFQKPQAPSLLDASGLSQQLVLATPESRTVPLPLIEPKQEETVAETLDEAMGEIAMLVARTIDAERSPKSISIGPFGGAPGLNSSGSNVIRTKLREKLEKLGIEVGTQAPQSIRGSYAMPEIEGEISPKCFVQIRADIVNKNGDVVSSAEQLLEGSQAYYFVDATLEIPLSGDDEIARNLKRALDVPSPYISGTRVSASRESPYVLEIVAVDGQRVVAPIVPTINNGIPTVEDAPQRYAIRLYNQSQRDAAVRLSVDGVNVLSFYEVEEIRDLGCLIVPRQGEIEILGWYQTAQTIRQFEVFEYPSSAGGFPLKPYDELGSVNAIFAACWTSDEEPPPDEPLSRQRLVTSQGQTIDAHHKIVPRVVGVPRAAVTIRYSR